MLLAGRPLLDTRADAAFFVAPAVFPRLHRAAQEWLNVCVIGERGVGKTTVLRALKLELDHDGRTTIFVNGTLAREEMELLSLIQAELARDQPRFQPSRATIPEKDGNNEAGRLLDHVRSLRRAKPTTIFLDGLPRPEVGRTLFGRLRDELWALPHQWVVAAGPESRASLRTPPADAFFDLRVELDPLQDGELAELLDLRLGEDDKLTERDRNRLIFASRGNPRMLLQLVRESITAPNLDEVLNARNRRADLAADLGRPASMLMAEIEARGSVSASDEHLLKSLGWTRNRATQVLRELEGAGLVRAFAGRGEKGGKTRLYAPSEG